MIEKQLGHFIAAWSLKSWVFGFGVQFTNGFEAYIGLGPFTLHFESNT